MFEPSESQEVDIVAGLQQASRTDGGSSPSSRRPVAFWLRRKQSTMRSPRLNNRPERLLYSGNIPVTPTSGIDRSRCPPFRWQLLQDILPGVNRAASTGVFVKIRKPSRISFESRESSSVGSVSGFFGNSQAVTIVVREAINGPARFPAGDGAGGDVRAHAVRHTIATADANTRNVVVLRTLTSVRGQHTMWSSCAMHDVSFCPGWAPARRSPASPPWPRLSLGRNRREPRETFHGSHAAIRRMTGWNSCPAFIDSSSIQRALKGSTRRSSTATTTSWPTRAATA